VKTTLKFKGGKKQNSTEPICKNRRMLVAVTNLNGTNATPGARILQVAGTNYATINVGT
jgi:hypothetical protein